MNEIMDEIIDNWSKWEELVDPDCHFGADVAAILFDHEDDKLGRINDLQWELANNCAQYAIECDQWFGAWGDLKRAAGFSYYHNFKEAA